MKCRRVHSRIRTSCAFRGAQTPDHERTSSSATASRHPHLAAPGMPVLPPSCRLSTSRCRHPCPGRCLSGPSAIPPPAPLRSAPRRQIRHPRTTPGPPLPPPPHPPTGSTATTLAVASADTWHLSAAIHRPGPAAFSLPVAGRVCHLPTNFRLRPCRVHLAPPSCPPPLRRHRGPNPGRLRRRSLRDYFPLPKSLQQFLCVLKSFAELVQRPARPATFDVNCAALLVRHRTVFARIEFQMLRLGSPAIAVSIVRQGELGWHFRSGGAARIARIAVWVSFVRVNPCDKKPKKSEVARNFFSRRRGSRGSPSRGSVSRGASSTPDRGFFSERQLFPPFSIAHRGLCARIHTARKFQQNVQLNKARG